MCAVEVRTSNRIWADLFPCYHQPKIVGVFPQQVEWWETNAWAIPQWLGLEAASIEYTSERRGHTLFSTWMLWERYGKVVRWILYNYMWGPKNLKLLDKERPMIDTGWWMKCWTVRWGRVDVPSYDDFTRLGRNPAGWCKIPNVYNFVLFMDHGIRTMLKLERK